MKDHTHEVKRQQRILQLIDERCGGVVAEFARRIEISPTYVTRMLYPVDKPGRRGISVKTIDRIESVFSLAKGWLDGVDGPDPYLAEILTFWHALADYKKIAVLRVVKSLSEPDDAGGDPPTEKKPPNSGPRLVISVPLPANLGQQSHGHGEERRQLRRRQQDDMPIVVVQH